MAPMRRSREVDRPPSGALRGQLVCSQVLLDSVMRRSRIPQQRLALCTLEFRRHPAGIAGREEALAEGLDQ